MGGRPKGSRNKLGEVFLADLLADWEENGQKSIQMMRISDPVQYVKCVASILPKELNVNVSELEDLTDDELDQRIRNITAAIARLEGGSSQVGDGTGATPEDEPDSPVSSVH